MSQSGATLVHQLHYRQFIFEDDDIRKNCTDIFNPPDKFNGSSCELVISECEEKHELINYLHIFVCDLGSQLQPLGYFLLGVWLLYLLSLLSTTVDMFFVPVLHMMSGKLHLPPSVAGMTLLALGNGAPDIFVAFSALVSENDFALVLGALLGGGMFVTSVVIGTVLLVTRGTTNQIDRVSFMRDLIAYMAVLGIIIAVAYDGQVHIFEVILFPLMYLAYVAVVVSITFIKKWWWTRKQRRNLSSEKIAFNKEQDVVTIEDLSPPKQLGDDGPLLREEIDKWIKASKGVVTVTEGDKSKLSLPGLTLPNSLLKKIHCIIEWPFSLLRWLTIPPCCYDGNWSVFHFAFAVFSPIPMSIVFMIIAGESWSVFKMNVGDSSFPLPILILFCVSPLCVLLFFLLNRKKVPNKVMQIVLMVGAFVMSICWLYLIASELVSVLKAVGLLASISTAILGLTVLAIGNSMADWVSDTVVAREGKPEMAYASCFGAPLITHVMGLSLSLSAKMIAEGSSVYEFDIQSENFVFVKMSWIFLAISLFGTAIVFPLFKFSPPKEYGMVLVYVYLVFLVFSILIEAGVMNILL